MYAQTLTARARVAYSHGGKVQGFGRVAHTDPHPPKELISSVFFWQKKKLQVLDVHLRNSRVRIRRPAKTETVDKTKK